VTTIAEVLHRAADEHLWDGSGLYPIGSEYSCGAGYWASGTGRRWTMVRAGLRRMGLDVNSYTEFSDVPHGPERQAARYAWLKFAAMIAEEQGV
jgi:hypothetical protein